MKNYFGFSLTGKKLLPIWLIFYFVFFVPYIMVSIELRSLQPGTPPSGMLPLVMVILLVIALLISFYFVKITIENFTYKDTQIVFNGKFGKYAGLIIGGFLLCFITIGVYFAWFIRNIQRFFINNSAYKNESFTFQGKGVKLFVILLLTLLLPMIALVVIMTNVLMVNPGYLSINQMIMQQIVSMIIMIPYIYFVYKWSVNINYKNYNIKWETEFWNSCGKIAFEMFLTIITLGIYYPMATIKMYAYFTERTVAQSGEIKRKFGFEQDNINDFKFIWKELLVSIITLGIYYPWAISKIGNRILSRTYLE